MSDTQPTQPVPQFGTAEYASAPAGDVCKVCKTTITGVYYRANGSMVCGSCADRLQRELPQDSHAAFVRALVCGLVGFAIGLTLYAGFVIITGISIGYAALAVGWIVGKAMMMGSKGIGGKRYQITAVLLTYAAVSMAFIPIVFALISKDNKEKAQQQQAQIQSPADQKAREPGAAPPAATPQADQPTDSSSKKAPVGLFEWLGKLAWIGLASPFLELQDGFSGIIGLIILFVGMQFAWKMTRGHPRIAVDGPFQLTAAP
jgi:hypothetical protein